MYNEKKFLALIPARGGSKRLKNKNIYPLNGKPLIYYTIKSAIKSKVFDDIVVSTDSPEIAKVSEEFGASVPFMRSKELATDEASSTDVIIHALKILNKMGKRYDYFMLLQPTSPLRTHEDILSAIEFLFRKGAEAIISVCEVDHPPQWMNTLPEDLSMKDFLKKEVVGKRSQDFPKYYRLNGAIFLSSVDSFLERKTWFVEKSYAYVMPRERSVDIDTLFDLKFAEYLLSEFEYLKGAFE